MDQIARQFFSFRGRIRRRHFCFVSLAFFAARLALGLAWSFAHIDQLFHGGFLLVAAFIPFVVRRLHDVGYSGWIVIAVIVMPLFLLLLLVLPGVPGSNQYGPDPKIESRPHS